MNSPNLPPAKNTPARPRRWRRWLVGCGATLVAAVVVIALWSRDEPPPDLSDLVVVPRAIPDEENAILVLSSTAARMDKSPWAGDDDLFYQMSRGKNWDAAKASTWLAANEHLWPEVKRAANLPSSQAPIPQKLSDLDSFRIGPIHELTQFATIRAWHLVRSGKADEAFASLEDLLRVSRGIDEARSTLLLWLTGVAVNGGICRGIEAMIAEGPISPNAARKLIHALDGTRPTSANFAEVIRNEHLFVKFLIDQARQNQDADLIRTDFISNLSALGLSSLIFKPNSIVRIHAEILRRTSSRGDADWLTLKSNPPSGNDLVGYGWHQWNPDNLLGRAVVDSVASTLEGILAKRLRAQSAISATQALLAVRLYQIKHGTLPETLSELVPKYFPSVPLDYYDRAPIRYSRSAKAIWSVGKNGLTAAQLDTNLDPSEVVLRLPTAVL